MSNFDAVCLGVITIDTIALVERYPGEDERVMAREISRAGGGPAAVAAVAMARLGLKVAIVGTIGSDPDGDEVLRIFAREGINTEGISVTEQATSGSVIVASLEHGSRAISTRQRVQQAPVNQFARAAIAESPWLHVDHVGINRLSDAGVKRGAGMKISFDAGYEVEKFDAALVDLFAPTDRMMALRHPGLSLEDSLKRDCHDNIVVATMGSKGSAGYSTATGYTSASGFKVDVVSTLGAGDVFHGALLTQIIQERPLKEALLRANAVAALSCSGLDAQSGIPTTTQLESFLKGAS